VGMDPAIYDLATIEAVVLRDLSRGYGSVDVCVQSTRYGVRLPCGEIFLYKADPYMDPCIYV
jgi:hypothetical protein